MIGITLSFPSGRFHATPWGRHVNEGAPEWPPSPWRFLRSLVAVWKRKLDDRLDEQQARALLTQLIDPPEFVLPKAGTGHSRHYMPWFKKGPEDRTLVFDAFVALPHGAEVVMLWPSAQLQPPQCAQLAMILEHLNFFGRAESWCDARLLDEAQAQRAAGNVNCVPADQPGAPRNGQLVRVLCADREKAFQDEHVVRVETKTQGRGNKKTTEIIRHQLYNPNWHLCMETLELHRQKWSDPPGSRWVQYVRPSDCFKTDPLGRTRIRSSDKRRMQIARFALDSTVLPLVAETLRVAETARWQLMGIFGRMFPNADGTRGRSSTFSGKDADGRPLLGHGHAYYLPTDEDGDGRLDHLTLVAEDGFSQEELLAMDRLRELKSAEREQSGHGLRVLLMGIGQLQDYQPRPVLRADVWTSATPFVVTRHLKRNGRKKDPVELWHRPGDFVAAVLREELARLIERRPDLAGILLDTIAIEPLIDANGTFRIPVVRSTSGARGLRPIQFQRFRRKRGDDGGRRSAGAFRITFPHPVRGPICLGHSAHFGLGLFVPEAAVLPSSVGV